MGKLKKGLTLTVDRETDDPLRRPRPVSQEGYYYPEEHNKYIDSPHLNSKRQPMRQYGSSGSLEVRHEHNRQRREQEFFSSPQSSPPDHPSPEIVKTPPGSPYDISDYYRNTIVQPNNTQPPKSPPFTPQSSGSTLSIPQSSHNFPSSHDGESGSLLSASNPPTPQTPRSRSPSPMRPPNSLPRAPGPVQQPSNSTSQRSIQPSTQAPRSAPRPPQHPIPINAIPQRPPGSPMQYMNGASHQRLSNNTLPPGPPNIPLPQRPPIPYSNQRPPTQYLNQRPPFPRPPLQHSNNAPPQRPPAQHPNSAPPQRPPITHSSGASPQRPPAQNLNIPNSNDASPQKSPIPQSNSESPQKPSAQHSSVTSSQRSVPNQNNMISKRPPAGQYPNADPQRPTLQHQNDAVKQGTVTNSSSGSLSQDSSQSQRPPQESPNDPFIDPPHMQPKPHPTQQPQHKNQKSNLSSIDKEIETTGSPVTAEDFVMQAIKYHEENQLEKSTEYFRIAAEQDNPIGTVLYGLALRHGWGCKSNAALAFKYLQKAAQSAIGILNGINNTVSTSSFKGEFVLAIYELGMCFRHGWGVPKNKATAAWYFEMAANLGDPDAQNDIGLCYYMGEGVKRDMKTAAKYYRMADAQGQGTMGNSWIFKEKYND